MRLIPIFLLLLGPLFLLGFTSGVIMIIGGRKMMRLESYGWGMAASIMALLPLSPANLVGIAVAIWSLIVLNRPAVKAAFDVPAKRGHENRSVWQGRRSRLFVVGVFACIAIAGFIAIVQSIYNGQNNSEYLKNRFVTRENYVRIKPAMAAWEVNEILGSGILTGEEGLLVDDAGNYRKWTSRMVETGSGFKTKRPIQEIRKRFAWRDGKRAIFVTFLNDHVESKSEEGLYQE